MAVIPFEPDGGGSGVGVGLGFEEIPPPQEASEMDNRLTMSTKNSAGTNLFWQDKKKSPNMMCMKGFLQ